MAEEIKKTENLVQVPGSNLDQIKLNLKQNRSNHVAEIFAIYDQLPKVLEAFKKENLTEDQAVERLGILIENVLIDFENSQMPLTLQLIMETKKLKDDKRIFVP